MENNFEIQYEEQNDLIIEQMRELIASKSIRKIRDFMDEFPVADIAIALGHLDIIDQLYFLRTLKKDDAAELFSYLEDDQKTALVQKFSDEDGIHILQELQSDELADLIEELPVNLQVSILAKTSVEKRNLVNQILSYSEDQVGSIMSVDISTLESNLTTKKALNKLKRDYKNTNKEFTHYFYVTNEHRQLLGSVTLEEIVFASESDLIEDIMSPVTSVQNYDDKEHAAQIFSTHDLSSLPVVDKDERIIGMITSDDVIDVIQEEATEDMYKLAGINPDAAEESYLKTSTKKIVSSRVFWLIILMVSATLSQAIIQAFTNISEHFIESLGASVSTAVIVSLIPVISGSAGNAGSQSSTTITRAVALGEIPKEKVKTAVWKEFKVSLIIGAILFIANIIRLIIYFLIANQITVEAEHKTKLVDTAFMILASSLSLWFVIILAKFLGTIIPIIAVKLKKDPAVMSAPILSTLSDAISTLFFFGIVILIFFLAYGLK
ncbi:magnesium transporter [Mycoplasmopsis ciconiae]|uniref:Magnesium transporter MgtE n=1 Tax=Mycoplasmopsis ciconiae TaxID=561067 RepID=A0ABU7MMA3_9BACT|nr:magnesium transporter [Mycoplasmopsis ciconiae]